MPNSWCNIHLLWFHPRFTTIVYESEKDCWPMLSGCLGSTWIWIRVCVHVSITHRSRSHILLYKYRYPLLVHHRATERFHGITYLSVDIFTMKNPYHDSLDFKLQVFFRCLIHSYTKKLYPNAQVKMREWTERANTHPQPSLSKPWCRLGTWKVAWPLVLLCGCAGHHQHQILPSRTSHLVVIRSISHQKVAIAHKQRGSSFMLASSRSQPFISIYHPTSHLFDINL